MNFKLSFSSGIYGGLLTHRSATSQLVVALNFRKGSIIFRHHFLWYLLETVSATSVCLRLFYCSRNLYVSPRVAFPRVFAFKLLCILCFSLILVSYPMDTISAPWYIQHITPAWPLNRVLFVLSTEGALSAAVSESGRERFQGPLI